MIELKYRLERISAIVKSSEDVNTGTKFIRNLYILVTVVSSLITVITVLNVVFLYIDDDKYYAQAININNWGNFLGFLCLNLLMICSYTMLMRAITQF